MLADRLQSDDLPQINMTPMVDVVLCLLVFFMAATRLYDWDENEFSVGVPEVASAAPLTSAPDDLTLAILAPNKVALNDQTLDLVALTRLVGHPARFRASTAHGQGRRKAGRRAERPGASHDPGEAHVTPEDIVRWLQR